MEHHSARHSCLYFDNVAWSWATLSTTRQWKPWPNNCRVAISLGGLPVVAVVVLVVCVVVLLVVVVVLVGREQTRPSTSFDALSVRSTHHGGTEALRKTVGRWGAKSATRYGTFE